MMINKKDLYLDWIFLSFTGYFLSEQCILYVAPPSDRIGKYVIPSKIQFGEDTDVKISDHEPPDNE